MADKKINIKATIDVDTSGANKEIDSSKKKIAGASDELEKASKSAKESKGAFSALGTALKGLGVMTAVDAAFGLFKETLGKNQKIADIMTTSMNFLNKAINDLVGFIENNFGKVVDYFKKVFSDPKKAIADLAETIKNNLIERIKSLLDMVGYLGTALWKLFTGNFKEAGEAVKNAGKELLDFTTGISNTYGLIEKAAESVAKYSKETWNAAAAQTAAANTAKLASAQLQGLVEKYDRQAELLRQTRDDENKSISDRIKANNELGEVLKKQENAMLALADKKIQSARMDLAANKGNIDMQVALTNALNERSAIQAQVAGLQSEQLVNAVSLQKEELEMNRSLAASNAKILIDQKNATNELIVKEREKLNAKKEALKEEQRIELARLQENIDNTVAGTQARVEAQIAYNEKVSELLIREMQLKKESSDLDKLDLENQKAILEAKKAAQIEYYNAIGSAIGALGNLFGQQTAVAKGAALAEIAINTGTAYIQGLDIAQKSAKGTGPAAAYSFPIFYATQIAAILGAVNKAKGILSTVKGAGSVASASAPSISTNSPLTPQALTTQLSQQTISNIGNAAYGGAQRAYILESDINNSAERQQRLQRAARLG